MWKHWWNQPGPRSFVESVAADLRQGINVLIGLPKYHPLGLEYAVREALEQDEWLVWRTHHEGAEKDPVVLIGLRYATDLNQHELLEPEDLAHSEHFVGHVVWVDNLTPATCHKWRSFTVEYAQAVRNRSESERGVVCVVVTGAVRDAFPVGEVALSTHFLHNTWSEMDLLGWLHHHFLGHDHLNSLEKRLRMRLGLELMGFDPLLAPKVANLPLADLLRPEEWLISIASDRGWTVDKEPLWHEGTQNSVEGNHIVHSAMLALEDRADVLLSSCVWRAQLAVLFPLIEELRIRILDKYRDRLRVPFDVKWGVVENVDDLEIGHVLYQLANRISSKERKQLRILKDARNSLAHHTALQLEELQLLIEERWVY